MSGVRIALVAVVAGLAVLVTSAGSATGLAPDKMFTIEYSGTVAESAQPNAVPGNVYSENITFDLKVTGTPEQLATGRAKSNLTASGTVTGTSVAKPPDVPEETCQQNVTANDDVDYTTILAVGDDGSVGAQLTALLNALSPQPGTRDDFCWVDFNFQWLLDSGDDPGPDFASATQPSTGTSLDPGASHEFDYTGSTPGYSASVAIRSRLSVPGEYVALGDSYSSGEGAGDYFVDTRKDGCDRSMNAYPVLLAQDLGYPLDGYNDQTNSFAACSGAKTSAISGEFKGERAQIDDVQPDDSLITISIGGNDVGFAPVLKYCLKDDFCEPHEQKTVRDDIAAVGPAIANVLSLIRSRADDAQVVVVGYPNFLPAAGPCDPSAGILHWFVHISPANVRFLHDSIDKLNVVIRDEVNKQKKMVFVAPDVVWSQHTICGSHSWFVKVDAKHALTHSAVFFHPNAAGQQELEREILKKIGS